MSDEEQEQWKARWLPKGLPEQLLDDMINEANEEYDTEIGVWDFNRYAKVNVHVLGTTLDENEFYLILVIRGEQVVNGKNVLDDHYIFPQVPCTEIVFEVYKIQLSETLEIKKFGYALETIISDTDVDVTVSDVGEPLIAPSMLIGNIALTWVAFEIPPLIITLTQSIYVGTDISNTLTIGLTPTVTVV